jgi:hypothetical protein
VPATSVWHPLKGLAPSATLSILQKQQFVTVLLMLPAALAVSTTVLWDCLSVIAVGINEWRQASSRRGQYGQIPGA